MSGEAAHWWVALGQALEVTVNLDTLVLAAIAYWWWRKRRDRTPRLNLRQAVTALPGTDQDSRLLFVSLTLHNVGLVPLIVDRWCIWVIRHAPVPAVVKTQFRQQAVRWDYPMRPPGAVDWPGVDGGELRLAAGEEIEVNPGEEQVIGASVLFRGNAEVVGVYSSLPHVAISPGEWLERGWATHSILELEESEHAASRRAAPDAAPA